MAVFGLPDQERRRRTGADETRKASEKRRPHERQRYVSNAPVYDSACARLGPCAAFVKLARPHHLFIGVVYATFCGGVLDTYVCMASRVFCVLLRMKLSVPPACRIRAMVLLSVALIYATRLDLHVRARAPDQFSHTPGSSEEIYRHVCVSEASLPAGRICHMFVRKVATRMSVQASAFDRARVLNIGH